MLGDLKSPRSQAIMEAAGKLDGILNFCKRITVATGDERLQMLPRIEVAIEGLRTLAQEKFSENKNIAASISQLEARVRELVNLPMAGTSSTLETCPVCSGQTFESKEYKLTHYCSNCLDRVMPALSLLDSDKHGFCTWGI